MDVSLAVEARTHFCIICGAIICGQPFKQWGEMAHLDESAISELFIHFGVALYVQSTYQYRGSWEQYAKHHNFDPRPKDSAFGLAGIPNLLLHPSNDRAQRTGGLRSQKVN